MREKRETALRQLRAMHGAQLTEHKIESANATVRLTEPSDARLLLQDSKVCFQI
jgi:hypothetical protein